MSKKKRKAHKVKGDMTRGEFLGAGAAMAAAVPLGNVTIAGAEDPVPCGAPPPTNCIDAELAWGIPASHLNTLFGGLLPRVAAGVWNGDLQWPAPNANEAAVNLHIRGWIGWFLDTTANNVQMTATFQQRLEDLRDYLTENMAVPIKFPAMPGYDMILSEEGIDLFRPPDPSSLGQDEVQVLLRHYTYRTTGRSPIGLPGLFGGPNQYSAPHMIAAATGASQMEVLPPTTTQPDGTVVTAVEGCVDVKGVIERVRRILFRWRDPEDTRAVIERLHDLLVDRLEMDQVKFEDDVAQILMNVSSEFGFEPAKLRAIEEVLAAVRAFLLLRNEQCEPPPTYEEYFCEQRNRRCWQLSGAVYRGILEQFPRIVAQVWYDRLDKPPMRLADAIADPSDTDYRDLHTRIRERLETALPRLDQMVVDIRPKGLENLDQYARLNPNSDLAAVWTTHDVMVTNRGLHFPNVGSAPNANFMYRQIIDGMAGNPIFTDSSQTVD